MYSFKSSEPSMARIFIYFFQKTLAVQQTVNFLYCFSFSSLTPSTVSSWRAIPREETKQEVQWMKYVQPHLWTSKQKQNKKQTNKQTQNKVQKDQMKIQDLHSGQLGSRYTQPHMVYLLNQTGFQHAAQPVMSLPDNIRSIRGRRPTAW